MENQFQTSFIPKKQFAPQTNVVKLKPKRSTSLFTIMSVVIFITIAAISIGVFFYKMYEQGQNQQLSDKMIVARSKFSSKDLDTISKLDHRIQGAQELLKKHVALTSFFTILQDLTLKSVRFMDFHYVQEGNSLNITMNGEGQGYAAVALQAQIFNDSNRNKYIKNTKIGNLAITDKTGVVTFSFSGTVDTSSVLYSNTLDNNAQ